MQQQSGRPLDRSPLVLPVTGSGSPMRSATCPRADALGVSRVLPLEVNGEVKVGRKNYPQTLPLADHEVVLTFDDGPASQTTVRVLDALRRECVQATFFLIGRNALMHSDLVRREIAEGHTVAHHSWSHPAATLRGLPTAAAVAEITRGMQAVDAAGWGGEIPGGLPHVPFFRFPGFADTQSLLAFLASRHIAVFGADLWASDWLPMSPASELQLVLHRLEQSRGGILLLHDTRAQTAAMLPDLLRELRLRGFRVVHVTPAPAAPRTTAIPLAAVRNTYHMH